MQEAIISFMLVMLIEAICALVAYLKSKLMGHMFGNDGDMGFGFDGQPA
jgi:hypothetical protein